VPFLGLEFERVVSIAASPEDFREEAGSGSRQPRSFDLRLCIFSHRTLCIPEGPRVTRLSLRNVNGCFTFQLGARVDQSACLQQRYDCYEAIYDFSLHLFQVRRRRWPLVCYLCITDVIAPQRFVIRRTDAILRRRNSCSYLLCNPSSYSTSYRT